MNVSDPAVRDDGPVGVYTRAAGHAREWWRVSISGRANMYRIEHGHDDEVDVDTVVDLDNLEAKLLKWRREGFVSEAGREDEERAVRAGSAFAAELQRASARVRSAREAAGHARGAHAQTVRIGGLDLRVFKRFGARDLRGLAAIECGHENPDGEALAWAAARLSERKARRRLLFVLSDGYPSTSDGDPAVLRRDLLARVQAVTESGIELVGIGIQDDAVEAFYPNAVVVRKLHELPTVAFETLSRLLTGRVR